MSLFPKAFQYQRSIRTLVQGVWTLSAPTTSTAYGSIQPVSGNDIANLEPATLQKGAMVLYTKTVMHMRVEGSNEVPDRVIFEGSKWQVVQEFPYTNGIIPHRKYIIEREGPV